MSRDDNETGYFMFTSTSPLMRLIWFNCNRIFNEFGFIFLNSRRVQGGFGYCYSPDYILKIFFYYFILYFNINNNNN